jgi:hypothetical protein
LAGSSRISTCGSCRRAVPSARRWRMPPPHQVPPRRARHGRLHRTSGRSGLGRQARNPLGHRGAISRRRATRPPGCRACAASRRSAHSPIGRSPWPSAGSVPRFTGRWVAYRACAACRRSIYVGPACGAGGVCR